MRDRMEKLVILPFSVGCMSEASVAVGIPQPRKSRSPAATKGSCKGEEESESEEGRKVLAPKPNISTGFNKLMKGFKNLSLMFGEKVVELEEEEEAAAAAAGDMQIGGPTDVQHVTHIGWDEHAISANPGVPMSSWDLLSLSLHNCHTQ